MCGNPTLFHPAKSIEKNKEINMSTYKSIEEDKN